MFVPFKRNKLAAIIGVVLVSSLALTACITPEEGEIGKEGAEGVEGPTGAQGPAGAVGADGVAGADGTNGRDDQRFYTAATLKRLVTLPLGSEATGMFVSADGDLFFNTQHPSTSNAAPHDKATVGVVQNLNIEALGNFVGVPIPATDADKQTVKVAQGTHQILLSEGDTLTSSNDIAGEIRTADDSAVIKQSNDPDFNAFISTGANTGMLFTNWEDRPGGMSRVDLTKNGDGSWAVGNGLMIDFSGVQGTWVNCFGTLSPWGTPLTAEELYFDDTADWFDSSSDFFSNPQSLAQYLGFATNGSAAWPNPYRYGYIVEITDPTGTPTPVKLFSNGRFSHENSVVMPDDKTVYLTDDGTGVVFYKFVADVVNDLSAGTLYAAKMTQATNAVAEKDYSFGIEWIELAHGDNTIIETWIAEYDNQTAVVGDSTAAAVEDQPSGNYIDQAEIDAWAADKLDNGVLDTVADERVAFLESRKAAAALGATAEFRKMEGININYDSASDGSVPFMYMAMAEVNKTMADGKGDVNVPENRCGIVYRLRLEADYNVSVMEPVVIGGPYDSGNGMCATSNIASPDNVAVLTDGRLLIGEDTSKHENNMIWVWEQL